MAHPSEPTLKRLKEIREDLIVSVNKPGDYTEKLLAINSQIRRREKELLNPEKETTDVEETEQA